MENNTMWKDRKRVMWFPISFTKYEIKNERLYQETGLLKTHYDEVLLYRIVDLCLERSFTQKIFGTGTVILYTKADSDKEIHLKNIKDPKKVKDMISQLVEDVRRERKVVGKEFFNEEFDDHFDY